MTGVRNYVGDVSYEVFGVRQEVLVMKCARYEV